MRYRPFGTDGRSISALTLALGEEPKRVQERTRLVHAALELGVNAFELRGRITPEIATGLGAALAEVPRHGVLVALRLPPDPRKGYRPFTREWVIHAVEHTIGAAGLDHLDLLTFDLPDPAALDAEARSAAEAARDARRIGGIGVSGDPLAVDAALGWRALDVLVAPYNMRSGWPERNRIKLAASRGVAVIGCDSYPAPSAAAAPQGARRPPKSRGLFGLGRKETALEKSDGYGFLRRTRGWSPGELCLAYALTEPALASVIVETTDAEVLSGFSEAPERDLPTGVPAQIEMARFSAA